MKLVSRSNWERERETEEGVEEEKITARNGASFCVEIYMLINRQKNITHHDHTLLVNTRWPAIEKRRLCYFDIIKQEAMFD